jgi:hypothetical protein
LDQLSDLTIVFSFDHPGFKLHCLHPLDLGNLSSLQGVVTGASSGIGLAAAKLLILGSF